MKINNDVISTTCPMAWVVTEGFAGTENQCLGVAEALGVHPRILKIKLKFPWNVLSPWLGFECRATFTEELKGPWPDLLIASGRKSIAAARYIKKASGGKTFTVQLQDPRINPRHFDLVAVPQHDPTRGDNVFVTKATPNRITPEKLAAAKIEFSYIFERLSGPRIAVLIGGSTKSHHFTCDEALTLVERIAPIPNLMITTSRRTGEEKYKLFRINLATPTNYLWDGKGPNPYLGLLAWADIILVTADSTAMISDAATTGKPVYILPMEGLSRRQNILVENLVAYGAARHFTGSELSHWSYTPLNDSADIAAEIRKKSNIF